MSLVFYEQWGYYVQPVEQIILSLAMLLAM